MASQSATHNKLLADELGRSLVRLDRALAPIDDMPDADVVSLTDWQRVWQTRREEIISRLEEIERQLRSIDEEPVPDIVPMPADAAAMSSMGPF